MLPVHLTRLSDRHGGLCCCQLTFGADSAGSNLVHISPPSTCTHVPPPHSSPQRVHPPLFSIVRSRSRMVSTKPIFTSPHSLLTNHTHHRDKNNPEKKKKKKQCNSLFIVLVSLTPPSPPPSTTQKYPLLITLVIIILRFSFVASDRFRSRREGRQNDVQERTSPNSMPRAKTEFKKTSVGFFDPIRLHVQRRRQARTSLSPQIANASANA